MTTYGHSHKIKQFHSQICDSTGECIISMMWAYLIKNFLKYAYTSKQTVQSIFVHQSFNTDLDVAHFVELTVELK